MSENAPKPPAAPRQSEDQKQEEQKQEDQKQVQQTQQAENQRTESSENSAKQGKKENKSADEYLKELVSNPDEAPDDKRAQAHFMASESGFFETYKTSEESPLNKGKFIGVDPVYQNDAFDDKED